MTDARDVRRNQPANYKICILGALDASWSPMLSDMTLTTEQLENRRFVTTIRGSVADQAALMGVLNLVYDLGASLLLVECESWLPAPGSDAMQSA